MSEKSKKVTDEKNHWKNKYPKILTDSLYEDEPFVILRANDSASPHLLSMIISAMTIAGMPYERIKKLEQIKQDMINWRSSKDGVQ